MTNRQIIILCNTKANSLAKEVAQLDKSIALLQSAVSPEGIQMGVRLGLQRQRCVEQIASLGAVKAEAEAEQMKEQAL